MSGGADRELSKQYLVWGGDVMDPVVASFSGPKRMGWGQKCATLANLHKQERSVATSEGDRAMTQSSVAAVQ